MDGWVGGGFLGWGGGGDGKPVLLPGCRAAGWLHKPHKGRAGSSLYTKHLNSTLSIVSASPIIVLVGITNMQVKF